MCRRDISPYLFHNNSVYHTILNFNIRFFIIANIFMFSFINRHLCYYWGKRFLTASICLAHISAIAINKEFFHNSLYLFHMFSTYISNSYYKRVLTVSISRATNLISIIQTK
jgi:hypothetical protein